MAEVRQLGEADRAQWLELRLLLWPGERREEFEEEISETLAAPATPLAFGAFEGDTLIGFMELDERPWGDGCDTRPVGWIEGIYVDAAHRRTGIGAALVARATDWARQRGYRELGSDVMADNATSLLSHHHWGFEETKRIVMFRKRL